MTLATAAAEYNANIGHDFMLADAFDAEYVDEYRPVDVDEMSKGERQAFNAEMARWFGVG